MFPSLILVVVSRADFPTFFLKPEYYYEIT